MMEYQLYPSPPRSNEIISKKYPVQGPTWFPINAGTSAGGAIIRNFIADNERIIVQQYSQFIVVDELIVEGEIVVEDGGLVAIL